MPAIQPISCKKLLQVMAAVSIVILSSCGVVPKNYPQKRPFVFKYNVTVVGNVPDTEKNELEARLPNQLDDSIRVRTVRKLLYKGINRPVLDRPPVYDSSNAEKSVVYMRALL